MQGSDAIARILEIEGVRQVFCFPFTPIIDSLADAGIRPIVARQERVAENMADGFSRTTCGRQIGVVTVQQSAGVENAFAGIAHARTDSSPILFLPGHPVPETDLAFYSNEPIPRPPEEPGMVLREYGFGAQV